MITISAPFTCSHLAHTGIWILLTVCIACTFGTPCGAQAPPDPNGPSPREETIVYTSTMPSAWDVYLLRKPGDEPERLTTHPALDYNATISPDGKWVAFTSERTGSSDLFALELEERRLVRLTDDPAMEDAATFSPDGKTLAFVSNREGNAEIYLMPFSPDDADSAAPARNLTSSSSGEFNPSFSPDGQWIAYSGFGSAGESGHFGSLICVMRADGSGRRCVASSGDRPVGYGSPVWSPDGQHLIFYSGSFEAPPEILTVEVGGDSAEPQRLEGIPGFGPVQAPDGRLVFHVLQLDLATDLPPYLAIRTAPLALMSAEFTGTAVREPQLLLKGFLCPSFDRQGQMVCHGVGPGEGLERMQNGIPFDHPARSRRVALADRSVTARSIRAYFPSPAADGKRLVVTQWVHSVDGDPPGPSPIVSADLDGGNRKVILESPDGDTLWAPVVSRDGEWIVYSKGRPMAQGQQGVDVDIWKIRMDGSEATNLTPDSTANDAFPDISADNSKIVFRRDHGETERQIYVMDFEGGNLRRLTTGPGIRTMPAISPDGEHVVFSFRKSERHGFDLHILSLGDVNAEPRPLEPARDATPNPAQNSMHPRYSPDGRWIVFTSNRGGSSDEWVWSGRFPQPDGELFALPVDGSGPAVRLTYDKWEDGLPFWGE